MRLVEALWKRHPLLWQGPLILQFELADAATELTRALRLPSLNIVGCITKHAVEGEYLDTNEVARQGVAMAAAYGYKTLYVLAAPTILLAHRWPTVAIVRKHAGPDGIRVVPLKTGWIPPDPGSEQPWTRSIPAIWKYLFRRVVLRQLGGGY